MSNACKKCKSLEIDRFRAESLNHRKLIYDTYTSRTDGEHEKDKRKGL